MTRREFVEIAMATVVAQGFGSSPASAAPGERQAAAAAVKGQFEAYKTSHHSDSTHQHPEWLG